LLASPWLLKNAVYTGNPFYPFFYPTANISQFRLDAYQLSAWGDWRDVLLLPIRATMSGVEGTPGYSTTISPLFLGLAPLVLLIWKRYDLLQRKALTSALLVSLAGLVSWVVSAFWGY
jgi:hypothetical protein